MPWRSYWLLVTAGVLSLQLVILTPSAALEVPPLQGRVNDLANLLSPTESSQLEQKLSGIEAETTNQIAILIMPSLEGHPIEEFSVQVGRAWALGQKGKNNGVLILMAVQDREVRIEVGYGLEGALTDAQSSWIIRNIMVPAFRQQQYAEGLSRAVDAISAAVAGEFRAEPKASNETGQGLAVVLFLVFLLIPVALIFYLITTGSAWQSPGQRPTYWSGRNRGIDIGGTGGWGGLGGGGFSGGGGGGGGSFGGGGASGRW